MKWYHWVVIGIIVILLAVIFWQCSKSSDKDARIAELADSLNSKEGLIQLDTNTWIKRGMALSQDEINTLALKNGYLEQEVEYLKQRQKEITGIVTIKTVFRVDTISGPADTVVKVVKNGEVLDEGRKTFSDNWFSIGIGFSCFPYQATLYHATMKDELNLLTFKDKDGIDEGLMISNKNPHVEVESVRYFFEKRDPNPDRFFAGLGLGSNNAADLSGMVKTGYGRFGLAATLNFNSGVIKDRKIVSDDWRVYFTYDVLK